MEAQPAALVERRLLMRTEDLEQDLLVDLLVAVPREVAERFVLNVAERFGIPVISEATARELDRLYARCQAELAGMTTSFLMCCTRSPSRFAIGPN